MTDTLLDYYASRRAQHRSDVEPDSHSVLDPFRDTFPADMRASFHGEGCHRAA